MGIKANFNIADIEKFTEQWTDDVVNKIIQALGMLGVKCVNNARELPKDLGFEDHTGNLRSSIGFKIFVNGEPVMSDYKKAKPTESVKGAVYDGMEKGMELADRVGSSCGRNQIMLVVTAGMEYAIHVESTGHRVISTAEQMCRELFPSYMKKVETIIRKQVGKL